MASIRDDTKMELQENLIVLMSMCKTPWAGVLMISYSRKFKGWWTRKQGYREISAALAWDYVPVLEGSKWPGKNARVRTGAIGRPGALGS